jgi:hypothetical protein
MQRVIPVRAVALAVTTCQDMIMQPVWDAPMLSKIWTWGVWSVLALVAVFQFEAMGTVGRIMIIGGSVLGWMLYAIGQQLSVMSGRLDQIEKSIENLRDEEASRHRRTIRSFEEFE